MALLAGLGYRQCTARTVVVVLVATCLVVYAHVSYSSFELKSVTRRALDESTSTNTTGNLLNVQQLTDADNNNRNNTNNSAKNSTNTRINTNTREIPPNATLNSRSQGDGLLPTCIELMNAKGSPYQDGSFLTRHTIPVTWEPRVDGSRELQHSMCTLHRYSAEEAQECLAGKHLFMAGDSLTRYQYLSLATFLHKKKYPPRFGVGKPDCKHINEHGEEVCSPKDEPNICMEGDWRGGPKDAWLLLMQAIGTNLFDGYMEGNAIRKQGVPVLATKEGVSSEPVPADLKRHGHPSMTM